MAKKIKNADISPEERLEQALIPNWDEPYKLPDNWCWVKLGIICKLDNGVKQSNEELVYLDAKTLRGNEETKTRNSGVVVTNGQKVILVDGENSGEVFVVPYRGYMGSTFRILNISDETDEMYVKFFIDSHLEELKRSKVGSAIPHLNKELFSGLSFPIPPLKEQERISEQIESLFAKLDDVKEKAQEVIDGYEARKAAILHKAFSGDLTAKWRKQNDVSFQAWEDYNLQGVCTEKITDGTHKTPTYSNEIEGVPFLSSKDVTTEEICWDNIKYITKELHDELYSRLAPQIDDILLAKNGTTGVAAIVDVDKVFDLYVTLALLRPDKSIIEPRYLLNIINSPICKQQFNERLKGIGVPNLHLKEIKEVKIPVPSIPEQQAIIKIIDSLISSEKTAKFNAEVVLNKIELLKKSILAKAFRGELGTNNPDEESALELLKKIIL